MVDIEEIVKTYNRGQHDKAMIMTEDAMQKHGQFHFYAALAWYCVGYYAECSLRFLARIYLVAMGRW